jgi:lipopolysaccharide/colanic/teichoic acid biosynthesis glycosyltransferase
MSTRLKLAEFARQISNGCSTNQLSCQNGVRDSDLLLSLLQRPRANRSFTGRTSKRSNGDSASHSRGQPSRASQGCVPFWKFVLDPAFIFFSFPIWLPLMLSVMLIVRISSPGPIFYRQERVGLGGRRFWMWKFRTMRPGAETQTHERYLEHLIKSETPMRKLDSGDRRLAPFGRVLRASGLDELPQLFNVLRGEMSLVGPRPCLPNEFVCYDPWQRQRVHVLPGITGFWQVNGKNKTTFNQMVTMDLFYQENMSVVLDLKIMLMTSMTILAQVLESSGAGKCVIPPTSLCENPVVVEKE